jgi:hypothetical protein
VLIEPASEAVTEHVALAHETDAMPAPVQSDEAQAHSLEAPTDVPPADAQATVKTSA